MGATISFCVEKSVSGAEFNGDGKMMLECTDVLDDIASMNKLGPALSSFFCDPEEMCDDLPDGTTMQEPWHDPQPALTTVSGLLNALGSPDGKADTVVDGGGALASLWRVLGIKSAADGQRSEMMMQELRELERCLKLAADHDTRFYLLIC